MKKLGFIMLILYTQFSATAQSVYETVLQQIEANNTTLAALRQQTEANKFSNRTGLLPANPEVEFNYLWGNPSAIGNRTDVKVTQTFDFPSAYAYRSKMAMLHNQNADFSYKTERFNILLSAHKTCIELVYYNALANEYAIRLQHATLIADAYKIKWEQGAVNILEHNKAQLNLTTVQAEIAQMETQQMALHLELKRMNGGNEIVFADSVYPAHALSANFEEWYATAEIKNPLLQYVRGQIEITKEEVKLNRALGLPKFTAGYMSEKVVGEHFQGVTVGITIPMWENKNRVKQAKAQARAAELLYEDNKIQFYNYLQSVYFKAVSLQQSAHQIWQSLAIHSNEPLLKKALDTGEISLLDYLLEVEFYYNAINKAWEAERDFELAAAELLFIVD